MTDKVSDGDLGVIALKDSESGHMARELLTLRRREREARAALEAELAAVKEIRQHGCECSDDDACQFARDRDKAQADLLLARQENERLRAALEARIRELEACVLEYWHAKDWAAVGAADSTAAKLLPADMKARAALKEGT